MGSARTATDGDGREFAVTEREWRDYVAHHKPNPDPEVERLCREFDRALADAWAADPVAPVFVTTWLQCSTPGYIKELVGRLNSVYMGAAHVEFDGGGKFRITREYGD